MTKKNLRIIILSMKPQSEIAYLDLLQRGKRHTTDIEMAKKAAERYGKTPYHYLSPRVAKTYAKAFPELKKPVKKNGKVV